MKGFVTLATGDLHYYYLAYNLVRSYKYRKGTYPFAILCDRENEYTRAFDKVVLLKNTSNNYLDKFRLLTDCPYDENFFIEPDCLIYQNVDKFWDYFINATDLSSFGWNEADPGVFINTDDLYETFQIRTAPLFCPAYFYIRKGDTCEKMYQDALRVSEHIITHRDRHPKAFVGGTLRDDPVFFCAMKLNNCACAVKPSVGKCIHYPAFRQRNRHYPKMFFLKGYLEDDDKNSQANLCHFSTKHTRLGKYRQQVAAMNCYLRGRTAMGKLIETQAMEKIFCLYWKAKYILSGRS